MLSKLRIALISRDKSLTDQLTLRLQGKGFQAVALAKLSAVLGFVYSDPPDFIIIDLAVDDEESRAIIKGLKEDSYFCIIPIIALVRHTTQESLEWEQYPVDDFLYHPVDYPELLNRIALCFQRIQRVFDNNPLTKLPGNTSIQRAIERSLGKDMAVCYIDINNFKPYNDTYGFANGDEVIRMVARIMSNAVRQAGEGFAGHIGGDDFVFIVPLEKATNVCETIIANFDDIASDLFGDEEKAKGYYRAKDRQGKMQNIPLLGISLAVVPTNAPKIQHYGMVAEIAAELKKLAKKANKSCYVVDRRAA
ncbi:MAG: diguanylate cyclase [Nitrospirota bacterium]|nr:diguanylate cyclase [Nitrospirota bacterium]